MTYVELPQVHVSELQHCPMSEPTHVALLCRGPHFPSIALTGSMTRRTSRSQKDVCHPMK